MQFLRSPYVPLAAGALAAGVAVYFAIYAVPKASTVDVNKTVDDAMYGILNALFKGVSFTDEPPPQVVQDFAKKVDAGDPVAIDQMNQVKKAILDGLAGKRKNDAPPPPIPSPVPTPVARAIAGAVNRGVDATPPPPVLQKMIDDATKDPAKKATMEDVARALQAKLFPH